MNIFAGIKGSIKVMGKYMKAKWKIRLSPEMRIDVRLAYIKNVEDKSIRLPH